jgi:hypothetical protein
MYPILLQEKNGNLLSFFMRIGVLPQERKELSKI